MNSSQHRALDLLIQGASQKPFDWATHNCCTFVGEALLLLTGVDHLAPWRGVVTLKDALRALQPFEGLDEAVTVALGPPIAPLLAQYGDVVLLENTEGVGGSIALCVGPRVVAPGADGLVYTPLSEAVKAWRVHASHT